MPAAQHDYTRPMTKGATFGFGLMVLGLAALTFCVTIWGVDFTTELHAQETVATLTESIDLRPVLEARAEVILEPKTTERLPVFGGLVPSSK